MTEDRRGHDPYAPPPAALTGVIQPPDVNAPAGLPDDLDDLKKADLVALAEQHGLDTSGTKADLIARLRGA